MCTIYDTVFFFYIYSFLGWCCEVCFRSLNSGKFINSGFLNGAYCPIYGVGMIVVIFMLTPIQDNIAVLFVGAYLLTTAIEGIAGFVLHKLFKTRWWDYSNARFNIGGYVCPKFSLLWGLGACFVMKFIHPAVSAAVNAINHTMGAVILAIITLLFVADIIAVVTTIVKLNRDLGTIEKIARELREHSDFVAEHLGNAAISADEKCDEKVLNLQARMDMAKADVMDMKVKSYYRIFKAFPDMKHDNYNDQLEEIRRKYLD